MAAVSALFVTLGLDDSEFLAGLKRSRTEANVLAKDLKPLQEQAESIGTAFTVVGGVVVASMLSMVHASSDYGEQLNKASIQTGIATEQLAKLQYAAVQNEASTDELSIGLKKLASNAVAAAEGSKKQSETFAELGIATKDTTGHVRPLNDLLLDVADRFSTMKDGTEKSAIAVDLFGKGGIALIPTLNLGRDGLAQMGDEAQNLGLAISGDAARAADNFNDTLTQVKDATLGASNSIATALLPDLQKLAESVRDNVVAAGDFAKQHQGLTTALFDSGVALTGAGGLLIGFGGLLSILPKIQSGLELVGLSLPIVGVVALGAAIGTLIGGFVNAKIAGTQFGDAMDGTIRTMVDGIPIIGKYITGQAAIDQASGDVEKAITRAASVLKDKYQVILEKVAGETAPKYLQRLNDAIISHQKMDPVLQKAIQGHKDEKTALEFSITAAKAKAEADEKAKEAAEAHTKALKEQIDSLEHVSDKDTTFVEALTKLESQGRLTTAMVMENKSKVLELTDAHSDLGMKLRETIEAEDRLKSYIDLSKGATSLFTVEMGLADTELRSVISSLNITRDIDFAGPMNSQVEQLVGAFPELYQAINTYNDDVLNTGFTAGVAGVQVETAILHAAEVRTHDGELLKQSQADNAAVMKAANEEIRASAGAVFDDLLKGGTSVFSSIENLAKSTGLTIARTMFQDMSAELFAPLKVGFDDFFKGLLESSGINKLLKGLGDKLGGIFGGGKKNPAGDALDAAGGIGAGTIAGTTAPPAGGLGASMAAFLTNPWTIGIGAAIGVGALWTKSQAHHEANTWVQNFQNPFDHMMDQIANSGGSAEDLAQLRSAAVADYMTAMQEFATHGSDERTVARQAYETFKQYYGSPDQYHVPVPSLKVGMMNVPSDNFPAYLDKGEAVLTAQQADEWRGGKGGSVTVQIGDITIHAAGGVDGQQLGQDFIMKLKESLRLNEYGIVDAFQQVAMAHN